MEGDRSRKQESKSVPETMDARHLHERLGKSRSRRAEYLRGKADRIEEKEDPYTIIRNAVDTAMTRWWKENGDMVRKKVINFFDAYAGSEQAINRSIDVLPAWNSNLFLFEDYKFETFKNHDDPEMRQMLTDFWRNKGTTHVFINAVEESAENHFRSIADELARREGPNKARYSATIIRVKTGEKKWAWFVGGMITRPHLEKEKTPSREEDEREWLIHSLRQKVRERAASVTERQMEEMFLRTIRQSHVIVSGDNLIRLLSQRQIQQNIDDIFESRRVVGDPGFVWRQTVEVLLAQEIYADLIDAFSRQYRETGSGVSPTVFFSIDRGGWFMGGEVKTQRLEVSEN